MITLFLGVQFLGLTYFAREAKAITGAPDVVAALTTKWTTDSVTDSLLAAGLGALVNGTSFFMRKLAFDSAKYVASAGKGQGALAFQEGAVKYFKNVALDSAAGAIDAFGEGLFGQSLCRPPDLRVQAYIQVSLRNLYADPNDNSGPQPRCSWSEFTTSWEAGADNAFGLKDSFGGADSVSEAFANSISVEQSDFGIAIGLQEQVGRQVAQQQAGAQQERSEGEGFKGLTGLISGNIKTPAQLVKEETKSLTAKQQGELSTQQIAGVYGSSALQIIPSALSVFVNTLTNQLLGDLLAGEGLFGDDPSGDGGGAGGVGNSVTNPFASVLNVNRQAAEKAFAYLITPIPTQLSEFDIISTYVSCPNQGKNVGLNNCVMDDGLRQAVQRANSGSPMTIQEALDAGLLEADRDLVSPLRIGDNADILNCWTGSYCYSNIQKLRKVRILPLGFEIAALKSDPDQPWKLGEVVAGFKDCEVNDKGVVVASAAKPFCHLIDPNWIIAAPPAQCDAFVVGPELVNSDSAQRGNECVDISTCLEKDANGRCIDYGYCLREENTWNLGGNTCPAQFATCDSYTNTKTNKTASYISRTVDFGQCTVEDVGCRAYSVLKSGENWTPSSKFNPSLTVLGLNPTRYFNDAITSETCPAGKVGCHAFYPQLPDGSKSTSPLYMKKAPDTLGCYDIDPVQLGNQWPEKQADFDSLLGSADSCSDFAAACLPNEVGCREYRPLNESIPALTGVIGQNSCKSSCVGYDTFKQEASTFEVEHFPLHFIPAQAAGCSPQYEGCSEFTNISPAAEGGEQKEYYTSLRYCEKPTEDNERVYYSWEGSANLGYVLKVHSMLQVSNDAANYVSSLNLNITESLSTFYPVGSPAYVHDTKQTLEENYELCNENVYNLLVNNPSHPDLKEESESCRALYDEDGVIFYRLMEQTVTVDDACHPIRATESFLEEDTALTAAGSAQCEFKGGLWGDDPDDNTSNLVCRRCLNGGKYENGACVYDTISTPGESTSCSPQANLCRAFTGNTGNNVQEVAFMTFDPNSDDGDALIEAKEGWSTGNVVADSALVGGKSLQVESQFLTYQFPTSTIKKDAWYELSFWARGTPQSFAIDLMQDINGGKNYSWSQADFTSNPAIEDSDVYVSIGQEWQEYKLGPVQFTGNEDFTTVLRFVSIQDNKGEPYFIDNVRITRQTKFHAIRDSWKELNGGNDVPLECDANPTDGLPGIALGCNAYEDVAAGSTVFATGFEKLCRPGAAGCQAVYDTQNTIGTDDESLVHMYNTRCVGEGGTACNVTEQEVVVGTCEIPFGETQCYVESKIAVVSPFDLDFTFVDGNLNNPSIIGRSTVIIPADSEEAVYLTNRKEFACESRFLGCTQVALEEQTLPDAQQDSSFTFSELNILDNPQKYVETLCRADLLGCSENRSGNNVVYFKDPQITGKPLCSYKEKNTENEFGGWFMDGVGTCTTNTDQLCKVDADCGEEDTCNPDTIGNQACYGDYLKPGGEYGIWSQSSENYDGFVGSCAPQYNGCTELIDRADDNKSYSVLVNDNLVKRSGECQGKASQKEGCVLFDQLENPNKLYDTSATYDASNAAQGALASLVSNESNDANVLLKVTRDRQCSEWLDCQDYVTVKNEDGTNREVCYNFGSCLEHNDDGECIDWRSTGEGEVSLITPSNYVTRDVTWKGDDYSGYSILNSHQIYNLETVTFPGSTDSLLVYQVPKALFINSPQLGCQNKAPDSFASCGFDNGGRCYENQCIYPVVGKFGTEINTVEQAAEILLGGSCKMFPEKDSPYPAFFGTEFTTYESADTSGLQRKEYVQKKSGFEQANVCQDGECSCSYKKVTYAGVQKSDYLSKDQIVIPKGVCSGGDYRGRVCARDLDCQVFEEDGTLVSSGTCSTVESVSNHVGLTGFCLEQDLSRPIDVEKGLYECLTWLPMDISTDNVDAFNNFSEAGYYPPLDAQTVYPDGTAAITGQIYCADSSADSLGTIDEEFYTSLSNDPVLNTVKIDYEGAPPSAAPDCNGDGAVNEKDTLACNYNAMTHLFNTYGDYMYAGDAFSPSDSPFEYGPKVSKQEYIKKAYTLAQHWAWMGGAEATESLAEKMDGIYSMLAAGGSKCTADPKCKPGFFQDVEDQSLMTPSNVKGYGNHSNSVVLFTSALYYREYLHTSQLNGDITLESYEFKELEPTVGSYNGVVGNYYRPTKIYTDNLNQLHYGPMRVPTGMARVATIDVAKLENSKLKKQRSEGGIDYEYALFGGGSLYQFIVKPINGPRAGETIYRVYNAKINSDGNIFKSKSPDVFFRPMLGHMAGDDLYWIANDELQKENKGYVYFIMEARANKWGILSSYTDYHHHMSPGDKYNLDLGNFEGKGLVTPYFAVVADMQPRCTQFEVVYSETPVGVQSQTNKAYTNRTWRYAKEKGPELKQNNGKFINDFEFITKDTNPRPFGSTSLVGLDLAGGKWDGGWGDKLSQYTLRNPKFDGIAPTCKTRVLTTDSVDDYFNQAFPSGKYRFTATHLYGNYKWDDSNCGVGPLNDIYDSIWNGVGTQDDPNTAVQDIQEIYEPLDGREYWGQLFKSSFKTYLFQPAGAEWHNINSDYVSDPNDPNNQLKLDNKPYDFTGDEDSGKAPKIYSLSAPTCFGTIEGTCNIYEENAITLNQRNGDSNDINKSALIGVGSYNARLNFFGTADDNHLPIKRVMVDWNDGSIINKNRYGQYKNRKPECADSEESAGAFGDTPRACEEGYFEFVHAYSCSNADIAIGEDYTAEFNALTTVGGTPISSDVWAEVAKLGYAGSDVCIYKPKVQLLDNWGWCNGVGDDGSYKGYYEKQKIGFSTSNDCDPDEDDKSFTSYNGHIIVIPTE